MSRRLSRQSDPVEGVQWFARYGTVSFIVVAKDKAEAELRVRRDCFDRYARRVAIAELPIRRHGTVLIRKATRADLARHAEIKAAQKERRS